MSGYGPQQELIVLQRYGLALHAHLVIWQIFEGNDLRDAESFVKWQTNPGKAYISLKERYFGNSLLSNWLSQTCLINRILAGCLRG